MKFLIKKNYVTILLLVILTVGTGLDAKESKTQYKKENISNYFSGIVSLNQKDNHKAFVHFKKAKSLKKRHSRYNSEFARTLILIKKFNEAVAFSKSTWNQEEYIFETVFIINFTTDQLLFIVL